MPRMGHASVADPSAYAQRRAREESGACTAAPALREARETMDERLENERQFHNTAFTTDQREAAQKYYRVVGRSRERYLSLIEQLGAHGRVLEYGCATGSYVFHLANRGARVAGIDISDGALEEARRNAKTRSRRSSFVFCRTGRWRAATSHFHAASTRNFSASRWCRPARFPC